MTVVKTNRRNIIQLIPNILHCYDNIISIGLG